MKAHQCAVYRAIRWLKQGAPSEGQPWTCPACGRSYRFRGTWIEVSTLDEIADLQRDPRAVKHG